MPALRESMLPPPRPRPRRLAWAVLAGAAAIVVMAIVAARRVPDWYAARVVPGDDVAAVERDARRLVTAVAGLQAAAGRPGAWDAVVREEEINAWLATDLPQNHAAVLPAGYTEPRVRLETGRIHLAARVATGPFTGLATLVVEVRLRAPNRLECAVTRARLGAIPLPAGPFVHRCAVLLGRLGFATDVQRVDGRSVIVVSLDGRGTVLRAMSIDQGTIMVAGSTGEGR